MLTRSKRKTKRTNHCGFSAEGQTPTDQPVLLSDRMRDIAPSAIQWLHYIDIFQCVFHVYLLAKGSLDGGAPLGELLTDPAGEGPLDRLPRSWLTALRRSRSSMNLRKIKARRETHTHRDGRNGAGQFHTMKMSTG